MASLLLLYVQDLSSFSLSQFKPNSSCWSATGNILVTDPEDSEDTSTQERLVQFSCGRCRVVGLPGGGAAAPLSVTGGCVLEAPVGVCAVDGCGSLRPCPEVLPAARTEPGECSHMS